MNRQTRLLIVIAIAVVVAGLASVGMYLYAGPGNQLTEVVAARRPLVAGARLKEEDVHLIPWSKEAPVAGVKGSIKDVVGRCLRVAVSETDPISETKLTAPNTCGLPAAIEVGMLAMSVKVNEVVGVAGFVVPGTHVDVIVTLRSQRDDNTTSRVVVRNVQVLAAGTSYDESEALKDAKPITTNVVTLMVTPEEAQKIALAGNEGVITLALRNPADPRVGLPDPTTRPDLLRGSSPPPLPPPPGPPDGLRQTRLSVRIASPKAGAEIKGGTDLTASVSGATGGSTVQWKIDGADYGPALTESPFSLRWDTSRLGSGAHTVTAAVRDGSGKTAASSVSATVSRPCPEKYVNGKKEEMPCVQR